MSIITYGAMVHVALEVAAKVSQEDSAGIEVVDLRTLMPLDEEAVLETARKTSRVLLLHEDTRTGGLGGELAAIIAERVFDFLDAPIMRVTAPDTPVPYSPPLEAAFLPDVPKVLAASRELLKY
jgi:2-oxoisovalerate dehydrogenase E1 component beta subunit